METPAILTSAIICVTGLAYLVFYTSYWPGLIGFLAGSFLLIIFLVAWVVLMTKLGKVTLGASLRTTDFAVIAVFVALEQVVDHASMYLPLGPLALFPGISALVYYFPLGIIAAALLKIVPKPGAALTFGIGMLIVRQITYPNALWIPRFILVAIALEAYYLTCKRGTLNSLLLMGATYGIFSAATGAIFMLAAWEYWQPLLTTFPVAILCGITMAIGSSIGYGIGSRAVRITL